MSDQVLQGTVIFFSKNYGFIAPDAGGNDVFVHYSDISMEGFKTLKKGQRVSYQLGLNVRGQEKATNVAVIS